MPIPKPRPNERRQAFMNRCTAQQIETEDLEPNIAGGICGTAWEDRNKGDKILLDHERDLTAELQALAEELEAEGLIDPLDNEAGFTGVADATTSASLEELEAEIRDIEVPEHMRSPSLLQTEDDLLQEP